MYSQNKEDEIISNYFGDYKGTLLDIGANDGVTLSNSRLFLEKGWKGTLVEPSSKCLGKLRALYSDIQIIPHAVSNYIGKANFWESGKHLTNDDHSLLSTIQHNETKRWRDTTEFKQLTIDVIDVEKLLKLSDIKNFDFISIDAEGEDLTILLQMDLTETGLVCIEWNGNGEVKQHIVNYCRSFGMKLIHLNGENLILAK